MQVRAFMAFSVLLVPATLLGAVRNAHAGVESRCTELGASCVCSEPLDTETYTMLPGISWAWNPGDTSAADKECNSSGQAGAFVEIEGFDQRYQVASSGAPISALPPGHTNTRVLRLKDGEGGMFAGVKFNHGEPTARRGFRYYKYYSTDYSFTSDVPLCNSSKWGQMGWNGAGTGGPLMTEEWSFYDIEQSTKWNQNTGGCCSGPGPGHVGTPPEQSAVKGKWIRFEFYMNNTDTTGVPTTFEAYLKNVTDDTPEVKLVDSSVPTNYPNGFHWTTALATALHPTEPITDMSINMFRSNNGQACIGYAAFSHFMAAAWGSNSGQRILGAYEIEGGSAGGPSDGGTGSDAGSSGDASDGGTSSGNAGPGGGNADSDSGDSGGCALGRGGLAAVQTLLIGLSIVLLGVIRRVHWR